MAKTTKNTYADRFRAGVRQIMAKRNLDSLKEVSEYLGISYMTLYKIMDGTSKPTVDQLVIICKKAGYSANWLLLDKGEIYYSSEVESVNLSKKLDKIEAFINATKRGK